MNDNKMILFLWVVVILIGVVECGYLRGKQKELDRSLLYLQMNVSTHRHDDFIPRWYLRERLKKEFRNIEIYNPNN